MISHVYGSAGTMAVFRLNGFVSSTLVSRHISGSFRALGTQIVELEKVGEPTGNQGCLGILQTKRTALANLLDFRVECVLFRSRIQNIAEMDLP